MDVIPIDEDLEPPWRTRVIETMCDALKDQSLRYDLGGDDSFDILVPIGPNEDIKISVPEFEKVDFRRTYELSHLVWLTDEKCEETDIGGLENPTDVISVIVGRIPEANQE